MAYLVISFNFPIDRTNSEPQNHTQIRPVDLFKRFRWVKPGFHLLPTVANSRRAPLLVFKILCISQIIFFLQRLPTMARQLSATNENHALSHVLEFDSSVSSLKLNSHLFNSRQRRANLRPKCIDCPNT